MAYIAPSDFRSGTLQPWCAGLELSATEADDARLTSAISSASARFDRETDDHYEAEALTLDVSGNGLPALYLPKRCRALTSVSTLNVDGVTWQAQTAFTLYSSLNAAGTDFDPLTVEDFLLIRPGQYLLNASNGTVWPVGRRNVRLVGNFSWTSPPVRVKRAVALLTWDLVVHWDADGAENLAPEYATIVDEFSRRPPVAVG